MWEHVTRHDKKMDDGLRMTDDVKKHPIKVLERTYTSSSSVIRHPSSDTPLTCGAYAGIDRNTADRFRKGELPLDGTIDLHGMTREKAHIALSGFMRGHWERGSRCVLVITGKGASPSQENRGILREMFPQWLAEPGIKPMILAFDIAKPKHGGSGAFYVLLRRKR